MSNYSSKNIGETININNVIQYKYDKVNIRINEYFLKI